MKPIALSNVQHRAPEEAGSADPPHQRGLGAWMLHGLLVVPTLVWVTIVLAAFANPIQPVTDHRISSNNPILLLKLSIAATATLIGCLGIVCSSRVRQRFGTPGGALLAMLAAIFLVTSPFAFADSATISRAASLILIGYLLYAATSLVTIGIRKLALGCLIGMTCFLLITWSIFLCMPSIGQFHEYIGPTTTVIRMGGTAHPNQIGREAAIMLLICLAMFRVGRGDRPDPLRWVGWGLLIAFAAASLAATMSRTSTIAVTAGVVMLMFDKLYTRRGLLFLLFVAVAVLSTFFVTTLATGEFSAAAALTKSGDLEELTSLTGRTQIWREAIDRIIERPWTGYGLDSAASVMSKESIGTHNLFLSVVFSGGIFAGFAMLALLAGTLYHAVASDEPLYRGLATFVLVSGLVEDTILPSFPCTLTILWIAMLLSSFMPRLKQA